MISVPAVTLPCVPLRAMPARRLVIQVGEIATIVALSAQPVEGLLEETRWLTIGLMLDPSRIRALVRQDP
jgi:hypothetical protein